MATNRSSHSKNGDKNRNDDYNSKTRENLKTQTDTYSRSSLIFSQNRLQHTSVTKYEHVESMIGHKGRGRMGRNAGQISEHILSFKSTFWILIRGYQARKQTNMTSLVWTTVLVWMDGKIWNAESPNVFLSRF